MGSTLKMPTKVVMFAIEKCASLLDVKTNITGTESIKLHRNDSG